DEHSIVADAQFVDAVAGDFRVKDGSPALTLGFVNFPMDQFGVVSPKLKAIARTPEIPLLKGAVAEPEKVAVKRPSHLWQAQVRDISGLGDRSAYGLPGEYGVLLLNVPAGSPAARAGLQKDDVILACDGKETKTIKDVQQMQNSAAGKKLALSVSRKQGPLTIEVSDYAYDVTEYQPTPEFKVVPLAAASAVLPAKITAGSQTMNEPLAALVDGKLAKNYGPIYGNGVQNGLYKLDLGASKAIAQINTFSFNQGGNRGRQRFVLYASNADTDPGWKIEDTRFFTPLIDVDTGKPAEADFVATSIRQSDGKPLGSYRWLVWAIAPVTTNSGGENTAFQEFQVIPAP
ncbi:MAG: PDZ domain-containing protein, partial [Tepidisphaeraceae bacterium]